MNTLILATDTQAIQDDGKSFLDDTADFLSYGLATTATSASVGIWNTVKAGFNMFGADLSMTDETSAVRSTFGDNAAKYYADNKVAVDFAGLLASSVVTGIGAINGLRAWQARGIVADSYKAITGLGTPDIVLGSAQVQAYRNAVSSAANYSWANKELWGAMRFASKQNVKDALLAEAAFLATNNQNALINPEGLSYVDSSVRAIKEGWAFTLGGAAVGVGIDALRIKGYAARSFKEVNETGLAQDFKLITSELRTRGGAVGDRLADVASLQWALANDSRFAVTNKAQEFAKAKAHEQLTLLRNDLIVEINKGDNAGVVAMSQLLDTADEAAIAQHASNLLRIERPTFKAFESNIVRYERTASQPVASPELINKVRTAEGDDLDAAVLELKTLNRARASSNNAALQGLQASLTGKRTSAKMFDELFRYASKSGDRDLIDAVNRLQADSPSLARLTKPMMALRQQQYDAATGLNIAGTRIRPELAGDLVDVLTDAATRLSVAKDAHLLAKEFPTLHRLSVKHAIGAIEPIGTTTAWYNTRTKLLTGTGLARARDLGKIKLSNGIISVEDAGINFYYSLDNVGYKTYLDNLAKFKELKGSQEHPALVASAHWDAAHLEGVPSLRLHSTDLPRIEAFVLKKYDTSVEPKLTLLTGGAESQLTQAEARAYLIEQKEISRAAMQAAGRSAEEIALVLNTGEKFAIGQAADDVILRGVDYNRAESVMLRYKDYGLDNVDKAARSWDGIAARAEADFNLRLKTSGDVMHSLGLGEIEQRLPTERMDIIKELSVTDPKATLITAAHTRFNSLREWATSVGAMLNKAKDTSRIAVETETSGFVEHFSKSGNFAQRAELAAFNNAARRDQFYVLPSAAGDGAVAIPKEKFGELLQARLPSNYAELPIDSQRAISAQLSAELKDVLGNADAAKQLLGEASETSYRVLSKEVAEVVQWHMARNAKYIDNDMAIATATGKHVTRDANVYYAPPPDLRRQRHVAFVLPKESGTDAPRFMLFADTQAALDAKMAYVRENHPTYNALQQREISSYKKLIQEYDRGQIFDELEFDVNLRNLGRSSDALPSLDVYGIETLDRMRNWHHNKAEYQIMKSAELRYADTVQTLRSADGVFTEQAVGAEKAASTVYADTVNIMLDKASEGGKFHQLYNRVQDVFGAHGSKALDVAGGKIVEMWRNSWLGQKKGSAVFTQEDFLAVTKDLESKGFKNPYSSIESYLTNSAVISDGRSANALSRLASTLVAGLTLRLDWLNSFVQVMSTPILLSGIIREAKVSMADPAIVRLTTVRNPANGVLEMNANKLMADSVRMVFSPAGKQLMEEARKRGILQDYTRQYIDATDFSSLNGRHGIQQLQAKVDGLVHLASKATGHMIAEDFSRAIVMNSMWKIAKAGGLKDDAAWAMVRSGIDKVHGVYRSHGRAQLFNGVVGQSMGLFQTYMFNMAQNVGRAIQDGRSRDVFAMAVMQGSIFGARSLPMFSSINKAVADTNSGSLDIFSLAGSDYDPEGFATYALYGLASHATVIPVDAYTRGDMAIRHSTIVPLNPLDWPAVAMIGKAIANVVDAGQAYANGASGANAFAYGLAHNALNRPLQGIGTMWLDSLTTNNGTPLFVDVSRNDYDPEQGVNFAAIGARLMGGKPLAEAISLDSYYRRTAYQTEQRNKIDELAKDFRIASADGAELSDDAYDNFMSEYVSSGGQVENFNAWVGRQLMSSQQSSVDDFKRKMENTATGRLYGTLMAERRTVPLWDDDALIGD